MIPYLSLPNYCKWPGLAFVLFGYLYGSNYSFDPDDVTHFGGLVIQVFILAGYLILAAAREKTEDEWIRQIRLTSLQWSVFLYILLRLSFKCAAFITADESLLPHWQINTMLLFYIILFYYQVHIKHRLSKLMGGAKNEE